MVGLHYICLCKCQNARSVKLYLRDGRTVRPSEHLVVEVLTIGAIQVHLPFLSFPCVVSVLKATIENKTTSVTT